MARGDYSGRVRTTATDEVGRLAAAFNQMAEDLATVDRERRDLIATVSHELRTPLTAMTALLENLADGVVPPDAAHLGGALEQAQRLGAWSPTCSSSRGSRRAWSSLDRQQVRLRALVDGLRRAGARPPDAPGAFDVDVPDDLVVPADPARLRQLLVNVLDNAGRHAPPGTPVRVVAGAVDAGWWLEVADAGRGVAPDGPRAGLPPVRHRRCRWHRPGPRRRPLGGAAPRRHPALPRPGPAAPARRLRLEVPTDPDRPPDRPPVPSSRQEHAHDRAAPAGPHAASPRRRGPSRGWTRSSAGSGPSPACRPACARSRPPRPPDWWPASPCPSPRSGITWTLVAGGQRCGRPAHRAPPPRAVDARCAPRSPSCSSCR